MARLRTSNVGTRQGPGGRYREGLTAPAGVTQGIAPATDAGSALAPWPQVDRYPIIIGTNVTFTYIASVMRLAQVGYRMQYVDLLSEWIDHEPKGFAELHKRMVSIASARYEIVPAGGDKATPEAEEIADMVRLQIGQIPFFKQALYQLGWWGEYSGVGAQEILWKTDTTSEYPYWVDALQFIHSRRLSYPNWMLWDLHVWDQGMGGGMASDPSNFGLRVADYPEKFIAHTPTLRGEYAVREGLGRTLCILFALKRLVLRCTGQDFERFIKPWVVAYYSTASLATGKPRIANDNDVLMASAAMKGVGVGSLAGVTLPDSIRIELLRAVTAMSPVEFLKYLDESCTMLMAGQSFTSSPGESGARAAAQVSAEETLTLRRYSVDMMAETLHATLIRSMVLLNRPGREDLIPTVKGHVEGVPTPDQTLDRATKAANVGAPVDGEAVCKDAGVPLIEQDAAAKVRLAPLAPVDAALILPDGSIKEAPEPAKGEAPSDKEKLGD